MNQTGNVNQPNQIWISKSTAKMGKTEGGGGGEESDRLNPRPIVLLHMMPPPYDGNGVILHKPLCFIVMLAQPLPSTSLLPSNQPILGIAIFLSLWLCNPS